MEEILRAHLIGLIFVLAATCSIASAQPVKITPLGSHAGELCGRDRATIFEDPTGVRILYDAGQSVTGADDPRLGKIDVVILTHAHGDHIGDMKLKALEAGTCDNPQLVSAAPNSTTAEIVAAKNAAVIMVVPLANFIGRKVETIRSKPTTACPQTGTDIVAPLAAPCLATVQTGGSRTVKASATSKAVEITVVPAMHDSTAPIALISDAMRKNLETDSTSLTLGPPGGYVIRFTNGLTAYLTGDTGIHAEMQTVERDFYKVNLMEINYGASALSPEGAAYVVNTLVQPASVILSHVNEAATTGGKVRATSRSAAFIALVQGRPVYPALSGKTMEFDGAGKCVAGC
jgi:L-ascorbate metabolism protein UlaG (beta-lactamase superfamily)